MDEIVDDANIITNVEGLPPLLNFPRPPKEYKIHRKGPGEFYIVDESGDEDHSDATFNLVSSACDYIEERLKGNVVFGDINSPEDKSKSHGGMYFEDETHRILISIPFEEKLNMLRHSYSEFLKFTEYYRANSDDWVVAYQWLDIHPAFWSRHKADYGDWNTQGGMNGRWESIHRNEDGTAGVLFEHGGTVFPAGTHHYHDTDLDTYSTGLEQAFVDYARKVDKHFNLDGTRKPVGYGYDEHGNKVDK